MEQYRIINKKVLIYGAGSVGKVVSDTLDKAEIVIAAYIDKRANVIQESNNRPVFAPNQLDEVIKDKDNYVIIITIRNVFEHSSLAEYFASIGFNNIIYKPITILRGNKNEVQDSINQAYEQITGKFIVPQDEISCYEKEDFAICDFALQKEFEDDILVKLPAELLFSNTNLKIPVWSCQNFYSNYIAVDLYEAFGNAHYGQMLDKVNQYVDRFALPGAKVMGVNTDGNWRQLIIDSRQKVYYEMEYKLWMDFDFFVQNSTKVGLRTGKGFELIASGKNRVSFLISKGYRYIPVRISKEEYQEYINIDAVDKIANYFNTTSIEIFAPIPHPFFYRIDTVAPDYPIECVKPIARFLAEQVYLENGKYSFGKYCLAIGVNDEGYMSRYFKMLGYGVYRILKSNQEFCTMLDTMFYYVSGDFHRNDTSFYCSIISGEMMDDVAEELIRRTNKFLVIISSPEHEERSLLVNKLEFDLYEELFETVWRGERIKGKIYVKTR